MILKTDEQLDKAIVRETEVEVLVGGEVDYRGKLKGYTAKTVLTCDGGLFLREAAEVKTI